MIIWASRKWPSITAQDVGRELYHCREDVVRIIGSRHVLNTIAWMFKKNTDMFEVKFWFPFILVIRRVNPKNCDRPVQMVHRELQPFVKRLSS
jgi:hypothetical protein